MWALTPVYRPARRNDNRSQNFERRRGYRSHLEGLQAQRVPVIGWWGYGCCHHDDTANLTILGKRERKEGLMYDEKELLSQLRKKFLFHNTLEKMRFGFLGKRFPLHESLERQGRIVTFASQFGSDDTHDVGLALDIERLLMLKPDSCFYGSASYPIYPFVCTLRPGRQEVDGYHVLDALQAIDFRSEHTINMAKVNLPHPGHHAATDNDELHTDPRRQYIFGIEEQGDENRGNHGLLRRYVTDGRLWYVLVHGWPRKPQQDRHKNVLLLAVGKSPHGERLVGVITHQKCRNLCD